MIPQHPPTSISPQQHKLKCWPEFFIVVQSGRKNFEIRKNDRDYKVGDELILSEWAPCAECLGSGLKRFVRLGEKNTCPCTETTNPLGVFTGADPLSRFVSFITDYGQMMEVVVLALQENPVCPNCGSLDVSKRHHPGDFHLCETNFLSCDDCENQWGHQ